jgi:hypothetical protein
MTAPCEAARRRLLRAVSGHSRPRPGTGKFDPLRSLAPRCDWSADAPSRPAGLRPLADDRQYTADPNQSDANRGTTLALGLRGEYRYKVLLLLRVRFSLNSKNDQATSQCLISDQKMSLE